ncbi:MAG TPA: tetratricopeptide repeat protein [Ohtaekwangia sp.]|nr:tetratricopeptide repeat protein [Ohtaekwangia sp.]
MKRLTLILFVLSVVTVYAQKPIKPNLNKALASLKEGKLDEAKANIDAAITSDKFKDEGKTWYYRGLIYASLDTTSKEEFKTLAPNAFDVALEAFAKADELAPKGKADAYFTPDASGLPQLKLQQVTNWANSHLNKGATHYQNEEFAEATESFDRVTKILPDDTTAYFYGAFAAQQGENHDKAIENFRKYIEKGGTSVDAYLSLYNIYRAKDDNDKALEVIREARTKFPTNGDLPKAEIGLLIDLKRIDEAKSGLESAIQKEPDNKILHFYLGYANATLNDVEAAKKNYTEALRIDPQYFEAQFYLARLMYLEADKIKKEMANLGITAADKKKRFELDKQLVEKLKVALPYWEKAEKINPSDQDVLDVLYSIYTDLDMQDQIKRIEKRYKELGMEE